MNDWICNTISRVSEKVNSVWWYDEKVLLERKMIPDSKEKAIKKWIRHKWRNAEVGAK